MVDVFVSYSSRDRERVKPLVDELQHAGWSVWWDRAINAGTAFDREIETALDEARCVVVAWSKTAVESEWVRNEAHEGLERGLLVPVSLDDVRPPLAFRRLHTIALDTDGPGLESGLEMLKRAIAALAPPREDVEDSLIKGREAYQRHDWQAAYDLLARCDGRRVLEPDDLEKLSWAAYWTARYDDTLAMLERAEAGYRSLGDARGVARTGLHQARLHSERRNFAVAAGIFGRVVELLASTPECPEHGLMACNLAQSQMGQGNLAAAKESAERARDIGRRVGDHNAEAMGLLWLGRTYLLEGRIAEGIALQDEATAAATSGELDPYFSGYIYCAVINACRDRADWHRAVEWTERADRWSERESVGFFPGVCRVHRAEILRFRGALHDAERECCAAVNCSPRPAPCIPRRVSGNSPRSAFALAIWPGPKRLAARSLNSAWNRNRCWRGCASRAVTPKARSHRSNGRSPIAAPGTSATTSTFSPRRCRSPSPRGTGMPRRPPCRS